MTDGTRSDGSAGTGTPGEVVLRSALPKGGEGDGPHGAARHSARRRTRVPPAYRPATLEDARKLVRSEMRAMEDGGSHRRHGRPDRRGPGEKTKILIVDDHPLFRVGIHSILEKEDDFEIVGDADDGRSAFDAVVETSPDRLLPELPVFSPFATRLPNASRMFDEIINVPTHEGLTSEDRRRILEALKDSVSIAEVV
jgi:hypothetical protein